jgi:hypothetical protein
MKKTPYSPFKNPRTEELYGPVRQRSLSSRKNSANMPSHGAFLLLHGPLESGQKSEQALSLLAVCGSLNADSVLAPKGGKNYLSHWLSR